MVLAIFLTLPALLTLVWGSLALVGEAPAAIGLGALAATVGLATTLWLLLRGRRALNARPAAKLRKIAEFDVAEQKFYDGKGRYICHLGNVEVRSRRSYFNYMTAELAATWPGGSLALAREGVLSFGFLDFKRALTARGIKVR
jgi:hypothetical protein